MAAVNVGVTQSPPTYVAPAAAAVAPPTAQPLLSTLSHNKITTR